MSAFMNVSAISDLSHSDLPQIQHWLDAVLQSELSAPPDFNWLGLAEMFTTRVTANPSRTGLQWAYLAVRVYDHLLETTDAQESLGNSQMMVRAYMINHLGSLAKDPVLDSNILMHWFFQQLTISFADAVQQLDEWPKRRIEWIRNLRQIKNRLSILMPLYQKGQLTTTDGELSKWFSIYSKLP